MNSLPPEVADAFRSAAITALQELVQVEAVPEVARAEAGSGPAVVATIQLLRESPGSLSLMLPDNVAAHLATRYLPAGTALTPDMIDDVAGEFANVIAGQAKTMLKGRPYHFNLSTPVVRRTDSSQLDMTLGSKVVLGFSTELGPIVLLASFVDR